MGESNRTETAEVEQKNEPQSGVPQTPPRKKLGSGKTRVITGTVMVAVYILLFWLRLKVSLYFFDAALAVLTVIGVIEIVRAFRRFVVLELFYPLLPMLAVVYINHRGDGFALLLLLFLSASLTDVLAYTIGSTLGKGRRKLAPRISPNKTYIGAFGGLLGGLAGSVLVWVVIDVLNLFGLSYILFDTNLKLLHYILVGIFVSLFTMAGDLFASFIKRKTGIKDYGKIFPGHGGVLDRFDGVMIAAVFLGCYTAILL